MVEEFLNIEKCHPFFTDGSKVSEGKSVGSSVYCPTLDIESKTSHNKLMPVFSAECTAISNAMDYISEYNIENAAIFSDSLSALYSLANTRI